MMEKAVEARPRSGSRVKFIIGGVLIFAAITYLIVSSTKANAEYFFTIDELISRGQSMVDQNVRISGAVVGESILYDPNDLSLHFTIANVPADNKQIEAQGGLAAVLHAAVVDPSRTRMQVVYVGPKPDLLRDEAQAIMTGHVGADNTFYADELLLKCPTKYEEAVPSQAAP
jgi:cytochrome c-type biogenesis protein CcmE